MEIANRHVAKARTQSTSLFENMGEPAEFLDIAQGVPAGITIGAPFQSLRNEEIVLERDLPSRRPRWWRLNGVVKVGT
jgi:hypothetical protein